MKPYWMNDDQYDAMTGKDTADIHAHCKKQLAVESERLSVAELNLKLAAAERDRFRGLIEAAVVCDSQTGEVREE